MFKKVVIGLAVVLVLFLGYVSTKESKFHYERSGLIKASPEKIFPYISQFKLGSQWSPYEKGLTMQKSYGGTEGAVGSYMDFDGDSKTGAGRVEITSLTPNQRVDIHLHMTRPMAADNQVIYTLTPEADGTRFTWAMEGDGGFMGKLVSTVIDCEKMIGGQMNDGINNLKEVVEKQP